MRRCTKLSYLHKVETQARIERPDRNEKYMTVASSRYLGAVIARMWD
jgi:hypothetical protein